MNIISLTKRLQKKANMKDSYGKPRAWFNLLPDENLELCEEHLNTFFEIMFERQEIWYKRFILKQKPPWTKNEILRDYKYTNVYRELDRASQWLIKNVLTDDTLSVEDVVWKIIIFRFFNQPDTFSIDKKIRVDLPRMGQFDADRMWRQVRQVRANGDNPWHTAYMMNLAFLPMPKDWGVENKGMFKDYAYVKHAFPIIHKKIPALVKILKEAKEPEEIIDFLKTLPATAGFQSHEFYIDFCYVARYWKKPIMSFNENSWTNPGPGAELGLRLIFPNLQTREEQVNAIHVLRDLASDMLAKYGKFGKFKYTYWSRKQKSYVVNLQEPNITLHQIEMWLCEFSKYFKMTIKQGKQRSKFIPKTTSL